MSTGSRKKGRGKRVTAVGLPPSLWSHLWTKLQEGPVLARLGATLIAASLLWLVTQAWLPPLGYTLGDIPRRDVTAKVEFDVVDLQATRAERERARRLALAIYVQDPAPLVQLRARLVNDINQLLKADSYESVVGLWDAFALPLADGTPAPTEEERQQQYDLFCKALTTEGETADFEEVLASSMKHLEQQGIIDALPAEHQLQEANYERILVMPIGNEKFPTEVAVSDVETTSAAEVLRRNLEQQLPTLEVASRVFAWLRPQLPNTLKIDVEATRKQQDDAASNVADQKEIYLEGRLLAKRGVPLAEEELALLQREYEAQLEAYSLQERAGRSLAAWGMYIAFATLCGVYIAKRQPQILAEMDRFVTLLVLFDFAIILMLIFPSQWHADIMPLLLFGMTIAIAYQQELALLLTAVLTLFASIAFGYELSSFVVLMAANAACILVLNRVRTRNKLLSVGVVAAVVAFLTAIGVGALQGRPVEPLLYQALPYALWAVVAGSVMTFLLPVVERFFGVQTDLSLLELGDPAHPLLQELIRRAPGTYNHSITVASLAEAAAESIGARGLLVRVGAYFHDIGKMLKPGYFVENQGQDGNRHQSLVPAMSTLVIIAHVKDGADLARQNKLPQVIIDFIQQHHGTTLVEYFYHQANRKQDEDPDASEVDESTFRYPGPKPQTKEAGILMLADAVESASRVLVEPAPARIEGLVEEISRKKLLDGQFDECGLTLEEVHKINASLVKSLTAVYHGRVKYPDQETA